MKKFARVGSLLILLVGLSLTVAGCNSGDSGMGKKMDNTSSSALW